MSGKNLSLTAGSNFVCIFIDSIHEILGQEECQAVMNLLPQADVDGSDNFIPCWRNASKDLFGVSGAHGIALRSGRAAFQYLLWNEQTGSPFRDKTFRMLPATKRMQKGLEILSDWIMAETNAKIEVQQNDRQWICVIEECPECLGRPCGKPDCWYMVGLIQGFLTWASGGKYYPVLETDCSCDCGTRCIFEIAKKPVE